MWVILRKGMREKYIGVPKSASLSVDEQHGTVELSSGDNCRSYSVGIKPFEYDEILVVNDGLKKVLHHLKVKD